MKMREREREEKAMFVDYIYYTWNHRFIQLREDYKSAKLATRLSSLWPSLSWWVIIPNVWSKLAEISYCIYFNSSFIFLRLFVCPPFILNLYYDCIKLLNQSLPVMAFCYVEEMVMVGLHMSFKLWGLRLRFSYLTFVYYFIFSKYITNNEWHNDPDRMNKVF